MNYFCRSRLQDGLCRPRSMFRARLFVGLDASPNIRLASLGEIPFDRTQLDPCVYNMAHKSRAAAADFQTTIRARLERTIEYSLPAKSCRARGHKHIQAAKGPWDRLGRDRHTRHAQ